MKFRSGPIPQAEGAAGHVWWRAEQTFGGAWGGYRSANFSSRRDALRAAREWLEERPGCRVHLFEYRGSVPHSTRTIVGFGGPCVNDAAERDRRGAAALLTRRPNMSSETRARIAALRELRWTVDSIAREVGVSVGSVSWALLIDGVDIHEGEKLPPVPTAPVVYRRAGREVRRFTQADDAELLRMEAAGFRLQHIAKALGRQRNSVLGRLATLARREARAEAARHS